MHEPDMPEPSPEDMFHMADYDGSGTLSAEGLCGRPCPTHEPLPLRIFPETLPLARRRPVFRDLMRHAVMPCCVVSCTQCPH